MIEVERVSTDRARSGDVGTFVAAHPAATVYAMPAWLDVMHRFLDVEAWYAVARTGGRIAGVIPVTERAVHSSASHLPRAVRPLRRDSTNSGGYGGPLLAPGLAQGEAEAVFEVLLRSLDGPRVALSTFAPPAWAPLDGAQVRLCEARGYKPANPYPSAWKPLAGLTETSLRASYHQSHRRAVEAARKRGVVVEKARDTGDYLEFADLVDETMEHAGATFRLPTELVVEGGEALVAAGLGDLWLARLGGLPVAGVFVLRTARAAIYWLGGSAKDEKALSQRPMHAVFHHAFVDAITRGIDGFELGGVAIEGLRTFKMRWGADELVQPTYERSRLGLVDGLRRVRARLRGTAPARGAG